MKVPRTPDSYYQQIDTLNTEAQRLKEIISWRTKELDAKYQEFADTLAQFQERDRQEDALLAELNFSYDKEILRAELLQFELNYYQK